MSCHPLPGPEKALRRPWRLKVWPLRTCKHEKEKPLLVHTPWSSACSALWRLSCVLHTRPVLSIPDTHPLPSCPSLGLDRENESSIISLSTFPLGEGVIKLHPQTFWKREEFAYSSPGLLEEVHILYKQLFPDSQCCNILPVGSFSLTILWYIYALNYCGV